MPALLCFAPFPPFSVWVLARLLLGKPVMKTPVFYQVRPLGLLGALAVLVGLIGGSAASAQTISSYSVEKRIDYDQSSPSTPTPGVELTDPDGSFVFDANINGSSLGSLPTPSITLPASGSDNLIFDSSSDGWHIYGTGSPTYNFASQSALDTAFPNGTYTMTINSSPITLKLAGSGGASVYPTDIPTVTNGTWVGGVLLLNAANSFNFDFNTFSTYASGGGIGFSLYATDGSGNATTQLVNQFTNSAQTAALTSYNLLAGTLQPGQTYYAQLDFAQITALNTTSIGGATGFADFENETSFYITTAAVPEPADLGWLFGAVVVAVAMARRRAGKLV
jgi:hypothetical protein